MKHTIFASISYLPVMFRLQSDVYSHIILIYSSCRVMAIPSTMIFFTAYDIMKEKITPFLGKHAEVLAPMASAITARGILYSTLL